MGPDLLDPDLIACLYSYGGGESEKVIRELNPSRYRPTLPSSHVDYDPKARGETASPEASVAGHDESDSDDEPGSNPAHLDAPHLELRFSQGPRTGCGFVLGRDPATSDIVLINTHTVSTRHCAITFETGFKDTATKEQVYRLVLRDLGSSAGTAVEYSGEGGRHGIHQGIRRGFRWILGGHKAIRKKAVIIQVDKTLMFRIVVPWRNLGSQEYKDSVRRFLQGTASADSLLGQLGFPSLPPTVPHTGAPTPGVGPICLTRNLGQGAFGVVNYFWDVSEGHEFTVKEPVEQDSHGGVVDKAMWKHEARMLGLVKHEHIVTFFEAKFEPRIQLIFEFVRGGSLDRPTYRNISVGEGVQILRQLLSALAYLHGKDPSILHRDIKPGNILVQRRRNGEIFVKFGDFGLSRERQTSMSIVGTRAFFPPELFSQPYKTDADGFPTLHYTPSVDIWSLGVTVLVCVYHMSLSHRGEQRIDRCRRIVSDLDILQTKRPRCPLSRFLGEAMVVLDPEERWSAQHCYEQALASFPPGASYYDQEAGDSSDYGEDDDDDEDQRTVVLAAAHPTGSARPSLPGNQGITPPHARPSLADNQGATSPQGGKRPTVSKSGLVSPSRRYKKQLQRSVAASGSRTHQVVKQPVLEELCEQPITEVYRPVAAPTGPREGTRRRSEET